MDLPFDHVEIMAQKIAYYTHIAERCQSDLRFHVLDDRMLRKHYDKARKQWRRHSDVYPVYMPTVGDAASKTAFFRKCDAVCASKPDTPLECARLALVRSGPLTPLLSNSYFLVIFAASGAIEVLISHEYNALDSSTSLAIYNAAHARVCVSARPSDPSGSEWLTARLTRERVSQARQGPVPTPSRPRPRPRRSPEARRREQEPRHDHHRAHGARRLGRRPLGRRAPRHAHPVHRRGHERRADLHRRRPRRELPPRRVLRHHARGRPDGGDLGAEDARDLE